MEQRGETASLQLPLPRLLTPDVDRLLVAIEQGDLDETDDALPAVLARVDTPVARATLARALLTLRERDRIDPDVTAVALIELSNPNLDDWSSSAVLQAAGEALGSVLSPGHCQWRDCAWLTLAKTSTLCLSCS
jgi:hypothetical protein